MRFKPAVTFALLFLLVGAARAQATTIVIVRPARGSPDVTETVSRLHGELLSLGLDVAFVERSGDPASLPADPRGRLQPIATARDADAVIEIGADVRGAAVDIYVLDRRTHRSEGARVALESSAEDGPARLALRPIRGRP